MSEPNGAVLIDYENVGLDSIRDLLDQLSDVGRMIIKRAYADWSTQRSKRDQLLELGIEAVHHFRSTNGGKNSSDILLAIDAVDLLHGAPIDVFVIVSSDSDFVPLVSKLRAAGKSVIGSGRRDVTSATLVKSCDRYLFLTDPKAANQRATNARPSARRPRPASREPDVNGLVVRALEASMDDQGQVVGSKLHNTMQRIDPSFSFKNLGFSTFRQFLGSCREVVLEQPKDASDVLVKFSYAKERGYPNAANGNSVETQQAPPQPQPPVQTQPPAQPRPPVRSQPPAQPQPPVQVQPQQSALDQPPVQSQPPVQPPAPRRPAPRQPRGRRFNQNAPLQDQYSEDVIITQAEPVRPEPEPEPAPTPDPVPSAAPWEVQIHANWIKRQQDKISGRAAADDAAKALEVPKLSSSDYPSLDKLLSASEYLNQRWRREGNAVFKR